MRLLTSHRGLTLIELMIGMVITVILLGMAAPYLGDYITNSRLRESGNSLMADTLFAQSEALKRNGIVRLSVATSSVQILDMAPATPVVIRSRNFTDGINATVTTLDFGSDGMTRPRGTEATIDSTSPGVTCSAELRCPRVLIDAGGNVRLCGNKLSCS